MRAVPREDWVVALPADDERCTKLLSDETATDLIASVELDVKERLAERSIVPSFEPAQRYPSFKRFSAEIRLSVHTFDLLINGRMGYRAQYYLSLEEGRRFNRDVIDPLIPLMEEAWKQASMPEWPQAHRSLAGSDAKIWPALDDAAFKSQPRLEPAMWVANCTETKASRRGLHLASTNPPSIGLMGAWISSERQEPWLPVKKRCRDELLRCFGFT